MRCDHLGPFDGSMPCVLPAGHTTNHAYAASWAPDGHLDPMED